MSCALGVKPVEIEFRDAFLSTYRSFTDANTLMNLLAGRYEMAEPLNLGPDEFETWKHHKLRPVQMQYVCPSVTVFNRSLMWFLLR